jgi:hypothetical protein
MGKLGVDYAWTHPGGAALKGAGYQFACRYLSADTSKNISASEANDLRNSGLEIVVVWETTANRALAGSGAGADDARSALAQANAAGLSGVPIYFAVDFDAAESQQGAINQYMQGAASVLGKQRTGVYGGFYVVKRCLDAGVVTWAWQTQAWSGGQVDPRAHILQYAKTVTINGVQCDVNESLKSNFGQYGQNGEEDMAEKISLEAGRILYATELGYDGIRQNPKLQALRGDLDADINAKLVGKELTIALLRDLNNSPEAKDARTNAAGKEAELKAYRNNADTALLNKVRELLK